MQLSEPWGAMYPLEHAWGVWEGSRQDEPSGHGMQTDAASPLCGKNNHHKLVTYSVTEFLMKLLFNNTELRCCTLISTGQHFWTSLTVE